MKKIFIISIASLLLTAAIGNAQENPRQWAVDNYNKYSEAAAGATKSADPAKVKDITFMRGEFSKKGYRKHQYAQCKTEWDDALRMLSTDGIFKDMASREEDYFPKNGQPSSFKGTEPALYILEAWYRLGKMADAVATSKTTAEEIYTEPYLKAIIHYGELEIGRSNHIHRFHESCFAIPTSAMNIYYAFLTRMDQIESGKKATDLEKNVCEMLKVVALQAWTQPIRKDSTDKNVVSVDRFRNHVWWVGGNGLAYRSLLPVACMYKSVPMIDVISTVAQRGISSTSQTTYNTSFWTEGFTADGAGWGHGMQCLIWGYPIDGTSSALSLLTQFKGTAWEQKLDSENIEALMNYIRGSNWYYYKGYTLPCLDRHSYVYSANPDKIKSMLLVNLMLKDWAKSFTPQLLAELKEFKAESVKNDISMPGFVEGDYNGTRYFYNNDDLIKKNDQYHIMVNMASVRCDGIESAPEVADCYNFTPCDGMTLFQRTGREYLQILGAFDVLQAPGITARLGMEKLKPVTNWRGYCSKYNFAAAATSKGANAVAGYKFEKMNASEKEGVNDTTGRKVYNEVLYGVQAYKAYFIFGDYLLAIGAGVTNLRPQIEGEIHTTIEQTAMESNLFLWKDGKKSNISDKKGTFNSSANNLEWLVQEGKFAYTVLPEYNQKSFYTNMTKSCDWVKMNSENKSVKDTPPSANILTIWSNHGSAPVDDTYAYVVYAGDGLPVGKLPFSILRNDNLVQAAATEDLSTIEAVFYNEKETLKLSNKMELSVSVPCVVLLEKQGSGWNLVVTDAQMNNNLDQIIVRFNGSTHTVSMPKGKLCGSPAQITIQ